MPVRHSRARHALRLACIALFAVIASGTPDRVSGQSPASEIPVTGNAVEELAAYDELMRSFVAEHGVPGASLCVAKGGHIVYARGFGWADRDARRPVEPTSLFRIASVSKPFTAVAVLQLVERGKIDLVANPFRFLGYDSELTAKGVDPRLAKITIRHLLEHTAGWDRGQSFDPMFAYARISKAQGVPSPPKHDAIIRYMLGQPLQFDPGSKYAYSNFGYCLLGRVIEKASGERYDRFVKHELAKIGIDAMRIGRSLPEDRAPQEVCYYAPHGPEPSVLDPHRTVPYPYHIDHEVMDSHGAWIASARDLVRFACDFDDPAKSHLLTPASIGLMFGAPSSSYARDASGKLRAGPLYGLGWMVRRQPDGHVTTWHNGLISGTSTLLVRRHDGIDWAVLFNTHVSAKNHERLADLIDGPLHRVADSIRKWPN